MRTEDREQRTPAFAEATAGKAVSPILRAREIYEAKRAMSAEKLKSFEEALREFRADGAVISNSSCFIMGKPIIIGRVHAWFACCAVGSLLEIVRSIPFPLPLIAFRRRDTGILRIYPADRFLQKALRQHSPTLGPIASLNNAERFEAASNTSTPQRLNASTK